jgi:hypothetical protein
MILAYYEKQPAEISDYEIDFSAFLRLDETVDDATATVSIVGSAAPAELEIDSISISLAGVRVRLSGGVAGTRYKVTASTTTSSGRLDESEFIVRVVEV